MSLVIFYSNVCSLDSIFNVFSILKNHEITMLWCFNNGNTLDYGNSQEGPNIDLGIWRRLPGGSDV